MSAQGPATMCGIARQVCEAHGLSLKELRGRCKDRYVAWPRQAFMAIAYAETDQSLPAIGRWLGGRHHTTILLGIRAHDRRAAFA
jgi:chromosomal replication initiation ATPase DnaA